MHILNCLYKNQNKDEMHTISATESVLYIFQLTMITGFILHQLTCTASYKKILFIKLPTCDHILTELVIHL